MFACSLLKGISMSTRSSKVLYRTSLTCTLFALLLVQQIGLTGTALAAKPPVKFPTPVSLAVPNPDCLDVNLTTTFGETGYTTNPPGKYVKFTVVFYVTNNCATTVSGVKFKASANVVCPSGASNPGEGAEPVTVPLPKNSVDPRKQDHTEKSATALCVILSNNVPIAYTVPDSISVDVSATGTDASGATVFAPAVSLPVTWI